jgi:putative photosynthetic complex assembly protein 2
MIEMAGSVTVAVLLWWASTGVILYLDGLPRQTFKWSLLAVGLVGAAALVAAVLFRDVTTVSSAYVGFGSGLLIWAVPTAAFYFGVVTGPRKSSLPGGLTGVPRFRAAVETMLYHEVLCAAGAIALAALTWSAPNQLALWTYLLLWAMHVSGKLNMFFGVPNLSAEFLPPHLSHLASYMRTRPMNLLFPVSVSLATLTTAGLATLLAVLAGLAVLEHWLLVLPLAPMALWNWSLKSRPAAAALADPDTVAAAPIQ